MGINDTPIPAVVINNPPTILFKVSDSWKYSTAIPAVIGTISMAMIEAVAVDSLL